MAMRHIHMSPKDAQAAGVKDGDIVSVKADNERGTIFQSGQDPCRRQLYTGNAYLIQMKQMQQRCYRHIP